MLSRPSHKWCIYTATPHPEILCVSPPFNSKFMLSSLLWLWTYSLLIHLVLLISTCPGLATVGSCLHVLLCLSPSEALLGLMVKSCDWRIWFPLTWLEVTKNRRRLGKIMANGRKREPMNLSQTGLRKGSTCNWYIDFSALISEVIHQEAHYPSVFFFFQKGGSPLPIWSVPESPFPCLTYVKPYLWAYLCDPGIECCEGQLGQSSIPSATQLSLNHSRLSGAGNSSLLLPKGRDLILDKEDTWCPSVTSPWPVFHFLICKWSFCGLPEVSVGFIKFLSLKPGMKGAVPPFSLVGLHPYPFVGMDLRPSESPKACIYVYYNSHGMSPSSPHTGVR